MYIRDRPFDFLCAGLGGGGEGGLGFFLKILFLFFSDRKPENFVSQSESQNMFFRTKQKQNIFF